MSKACTPVRKRFMIALPLGIIFGFVCAGFASTSNPAIWWTPLMWTIVTSRAILGLVVALAGAYTKHPVFGFALPAWLRGTCLGAIASLPLATGAMMSPTKLMGAWGLFWATIIAGAIYGVIIDLIATQWGGEGKDLMK